MKNTWWRHQMETFSVLLPFCAGNSPIPGEFPTQRPLTWSFDVFFDLRPDKRLSKQPWCWWFETPPWSLWRHYNVIVLRPKYKQLNKVLKPYMSQNRCRVIDYDCLILSFEKICFSVFYSVVVLHMFNHAQSEIVLFTHILTRELSFLLWL